MFDAVTTTDPDEFFDGPIAEPTPSPAAALKKLVSAMVDSRGEVTNSVEFQRIKALPRRKLDLKEVFDVTPLFRREGGTMSFWPLQSACLIEAAQANGLFALLGIGDGKTLVTFALPEALDSKRAALIVPTELYDKTMRDMELYSKHFILPLDRLTVITYHDLSSAKKHDILDRIDPDLCILDEAHNVARRESARTKRYHRFAREHPACRHVHLSGTASSRSVREYAPLIELGLRKNSPLPSSYKEVQDWGGAIDVEPQYLMMPGALKQFCEGKETVREGFGRRLTETPGVVPASDGSIGTALVIRRLAPAVPSSVQELLFKVRKEWKIDDEEFDSPLTRARVLRQIACGLYLRWVWPNGEKDHAWLDARAAWNKEVRAMLKRSVRGMDSPLLCAQAAASGRWQAETWAAWAAQKHKPVPPTEAVWISNFMVDAALAWGAHATKAQPSIIWYEHLDLGRRIAAVGGIPHYGAGTDASLETAPLIICSMRSQGTGKNLQHYNRNLATTLPPSGKIVEQVIGRTHRSGQQADEVTFDWYGHTDETASAIEAVIQDAEYVEATQRQRQRVLRATRL